VRLLLRESRILSAGTEALALEKRAHLLMLMQARWSDSRTHSILQVD